MKNKLKGYLEYFAYEWIHHLEITGIDIEDIYFLTRGERTWYQYKTRGDLIRFYDPKKFEIFGIRSADQRSLAPYFDDSVAYSPLIITSILGQLGVHHPITVDPKVVDSVLQTLSVRNFRWISTGSQPVHDDYQFRSIFLMPLIAIDLNLLLHRGITRYLSTLCIVQ